jgi:hypothetical protein
MGRIHPCHLDQRRTLAPRDYAVDPASFGLTEDLAFHVPPDGDGVSMWVAIVQHQLVCRWNRSNRRITAAQLERRFGAKKQTLSLTARGWRWAGETVFAALAHAAAGR